MLRATAADGGGSTARGLSVSVTARSKQSWATGWRRGSRRADRADAGAEDRGPGVPSPRERAPVAVRPGAFDGGLSSRCVPSLRAGAVDVVSDGAGGALCGFGGGDGVSTVSRVECCNLIARAPRSVGGGSEGKGRYRERPASDRGSSSDDASRASGDASWAVLWLPDALRGRRAAAVAVEVSGLRRLCGLRGGGRAGGAPPAVRGSAAAEAQPGCPARRRGRGVRPGDLDGAGQAVVPAVRRDADPDG